MSAIKDLTRITARMGAFRANLGDWQGLLSTLRSTTNIRNLLHPLIGADVGGAVFETIDTTLSGAWRENLPLCGWLGVFPFFLKKKTI